MKTTPSMTFLEALLNVLNIQKGYGSYRGRARRSEFWYTTLICIIASTLIDCVGYAVEEKWGYNKNINLITTLVCAYFYIANYSCLCRRMHDIGRSCLFPGLMLVSALISLILIVCIPMRNTIAEWFCIISSAITVLLLAYTLFLCTKDSDRGRNRYGCSDKYVDQTTIRKKRKSSGRTTATILSEETNKKVFSFFTLTPSHIWLKRPVHRRFRCEGKCEGSEVTLTHRATGIVFCIFPLSIRRKSITLRKT